MSALARYFNAAGMSVAGYDKTASALTDALVGEGISISFIDEVEALPDFVTDVIYKNQTLIIYTPAIPKDHKQYNYILD